MNKHMKNEIMLTLILKAAKRLTKEFRCITFYHMLHIPLFFIKHSINSNNPTILRKGNETASVIWIYVDTKPQIPLILAAPHIPHKPSSPITIRIATFSGITKYILMLQLCIHSQLQAVFRTMRTESDN